MSIRSMFWNHGGDAAQIFRPEEQNGRSGDVVNTSAGPLNGGEGVKKRHLGQVRRG